ncbi:plasmid-related protein [Burkholderia cenocepacia]|nr:plasmid-related protein [Burkholderia cenocepacia]
MNVKDCGMRIRVEKDLREAFVRACRAQDRAAAAVLREFMQTCVEKFEAGQGDLFSRPERAPTPKKRPE